MNPYKVLGLDPQASPAQIEATYRHLLRAHHPDLHHDGSPAELAQAEARTQEINQAMALIRAGWRPRPEANGGVGFTDRPRPRDTWAPPRGEPTAGYRPPPSRAGAWSDGFHVDETTDFFGNPTRERSHQQSGLTVGCPLCGVAFDDAMVLRLHLVHQHGLRDGTFPDARTPRSRRDPFRWLRWVPMPQLTLTAVLFVYLVVVAGLIPSPWTIPALWIGFGLYAGAMFKALWNRRAT